MGQAPYDRAKHAAAVKRKRRHQVEGAEEKVDCDEVVQNGAHRRHRPQSADRASEQVQAWSCAQCLADGPEQASQGKAGQGSSGGDQEFGSSGWRLTPDVRDATEDEQGDIADAHPERLCNQRMAELVNQH